MGLNVAAVSTTVAEWLAAGKARISRHKKVTDHLLQLGSALGLTLAAAFTLASLHWPHLYSQDSEVLSAVSVLLPWALLMLPINAMAYVLDGALVGAEDFRFMVLAMTRSVVAAMGPLLMVESAGLGLAGVWHAQAVLMLGRVTTLGFRYTSPEGRLPHCSRKLSVGYEQQTADTHINVFASSSSVTYELLDHVLYEARISFVEEDLVLNVAWRS
ncbi:hypothetical protein CEUSTIGMA_g4748.t1 [Chlamydomonas eustigma]|uniref:Protein DETOXIFICATION n=1 Tax=Chlamydomonas eustigma TaxID=1157962 RepID=A0A250X330_9CHLO|nr:hypothetical protein CEUSTIGMA_g4748.t1 [Chlamydomonas eustigma]|eukprot:GAX77302.1 hypothetical protein CEUSTIGMA_g4748.t1 [Chlamydomonas eustigma]